MVEHQAHKNKNIKYRQYSKGLERDREKEGVFLALLKAIKQSAGNI